MTRRITVLYIVCFSFVFSCIGKDKNIKTGKVLVIEKDEYPPRISSISKIVPFSYDNKAISFDAILNDSISGEFIFDSRLTTSYNLLSTNFANIHGFSKLPYKTGSFHGVGNIHKLRIIDSLISVKIFGNNKKVLFGTKPLCPYGKERYDGVFNVHIFKDSIVEFDYKNKLLKFHRYFSDTTYNKIDIKQRGNVRMIEIDVCFSKDLREKGLFILDTGYRGCLYYYANKIQFKRLMSDPTTKKMLDAANFDKAIDTYSVKILSTSVDGLDLSRPIINFGQVTLPHEAKGTALLGLVGNKFFERFKVVIDFKRNILYLKRSGINLGYFQNVVNL